VGSDIGAVVDGEAAVWRIGGVHKSDCLWMYSVHPQAGQRHSQLLIATDGWICWVQQTLLALAIILTSSATSALACSLPLAPRGASTTHTDSGLQQSFQLCALLIVQYFR
jgi:hypothetical protein